MNLDESRRSLSRRTTRLDISSLFHPSQTQKERERRPYQHEAVQAMTTALKSQAFSILALPTGSGKTFVANEIVHEAVASGCTVLWLALNWELIVQAASAYAQRFDGAERLARVGGVRSPLHDVLREDAARPIQYSTLHTWYRRRHDEQLRPGRVNLLVVDECHWGLAGAMGYALLRQYHGQAPILGLSATPRHVAVPGGTEPARIGYQRTFAELEGTYLATPRLETPRTRTDWRPKLFSTGDFSQASLCELAVDADRNELICRTLLAGIKSRKYSRIMVFACNVAHANHLAELLSHHGIDARALHYEVSSDARRAELLSDFRNGVFNVIVNVAMLSQGVDVPDVDAVFLTRPTASEVLCSQMVGRGARRIEGQKHEFWIVEFTDNLTRHSGDVFRARELLPAPAARRAAGAPSATTKVHKPSPQHAKFLRLVAPVDLAGLTYVQDQTFGVEIEFTSPLGSPDSTGLVYSNWKWKLVADGILRTIERVATLPVDPEPRNYHAVNDTERWRVEFDRSAGWEVVSPILSNQEGFTELANVLSALNELVRQSHSLHINYRTGLHVTLGSGFTQDAQVRGLVKLGQMLEPGIFTLVSPSRLYELKNGRYNLHRNNKYCRPLRRLEADVDQLGLAFFQTQSPSIRYRTVNLSHVGREDQHIEIRLHNGTSKYSVVLTWISLWMTLFNRAKYRWPEHGSGSPIFPGGDVSIGPEQARMEDLFALVDELDVHLDPYLREALAGRRSHLQERWRKVIPKRVESWRKWWPQIPSADLSVAAERPDREV